ncbi:MAG: DUF58 domain-containing protein [Planctomycetes bacterium]|nr:DUF58 domain-containing protein [Planctomycetota bacterium]
MPLLTTPLLSADFMAKLDRLDVMSRKILTGKLQGERRSKKRGQSVEFADYRNYVVGDDLRRIDWNLFARLDRFFLRLFMEEEDLSLTVVLDVTRSMDYGDPNKLDYARRVAAALGYVGLVNHNRVHLFTFADALVGRQTNLRGRRPIPQLMTFLSEITPETRPGNLAASLRSLALTQTGKGVVIVVSDMLDKGDVSAALRYLTSDRFDVYILQVLAPQEIDPAAGGVVGDLRLRDTEDSDITEVSVSPALLKRYKANLQAYCAALREQCARRDMTYLMTDTTVPFDTLVLRYLRERGLVG